MPLWYYTPLHANAKLSDAERELIVKWAKQPHKIPAEFYS